MALQLVLRGYRIGLLVSAATHAAKLSSSVRRTMPPVMFERHAAVKPAVDHGVPVSALLACDGRTRKCSLTPSRRRLSRGAHMQQVECSAPTGDGASLAEEMPTQYAPADVEQRLYEWWEASGFFKPSAEATKQCFVISMPPPNVTGKLHMGHAMFVALEDIMARFHRMRGHPTLWLPGTDHAGIATQMLVERAVRAEGTSRVELGRDAFLDRVWSWKEEYGGAITSQIRRLGASCDWSRERFTLQPELCAAVNEAFVQLHEKGLVYRGEYMVNWSPSLGTAVSDLEVDYVEEEGQLYYFKYPVAGGGGDEYIPVATTRPETILGDTAVCVHPEDERFQHLVGKEVVVPMSQRKVKVIADDYVQMDFGTGALKITPAHDVNDYAIGKRHNLPVINILNKDASINEAGGAYAGLDRYEARSRLWQDMEAAGLTLKVEKHTQRVPRSERSGEVIEPLVSTQWFVKMGGMAAKGLDAVRSGQTQILPARFEKVYFNWLENIQDWCVSRQLWWGHRIPVWYADGTNRYFVARDEAEAREKAEAELGAGVTLTQDSDVLDTWFSSGLWPFATVGWPSKEAEALAEYSKFYPSSVMETGYDILFFWVARMMMLGLELTGEAPFHTIYLHGLVRDANGQKMSKTKGNVIDPIDTIESMGTDALRLSLVTGVTPGQDVPLSMDKVTANRNFANKLWNTARFLLIGLEALSPEQRQAMAVARPMGAAEMSGLALPERWVVSRCHALVNDVTAQLDAYDFGPAGQAIYAFLWDEYADWYIEISKRRIGADDAQAARESRRVLVYVLDTCLRLLHPFMPFITEELWQKLPHEGEALMISRWPQMDAEELARDEAAEAQFSSLQALVRSVRNARAEYRVEPAKKVAATVCARASLAPAVRAEADAIATLGRIDPASLQVLDADAAAIEEAAAAAGNAVRLVVEEGVEVLLPMAALVDAEKERARLAKQRAALEVSIQKLDGRLSSGGFASKAPAAVVAKAQAELSEQREQLEAVLRSLDALD